MKLFKKLILMFVFTIAITLSLASCNNSSEKDTSSIDTTSSIESSTETTTREEPIAQDDIVIMVTNDVHCGITAGIGYAGVAAYKKSMQQKTQYVTLVDCGDAVQGAAIGSLSKGEAPILIMNKVGYDYAIFGNHEFDYGMDRLNELTHIAKAQYLNCNITYTGNKDVSGIDNSKPYEIKKYGNINVAFIGVSTPYCVSESTPTNFKENCEYVYDFKGKNNGKDLCDCIQNNINKAKADGADYVVLLTHLGLGDEYMPYDVISVINNISGADVVFDGHSHSTIPCNFVKDKEGKLVQMCQTGTKLSGLAQLVITSKGILSTSLITQYDQKDEEVESYIAEVSASTNNKLKEVITTTTAELSITDASGIRIVRTRETGIGNFVADAYKEVMGADIAMSNGGGVRKTIPKGEVTLGNIIDVNPFGNMLCVIEMTGQDIVDLLEYGARAVQSDYVKNGQALGEEGSFMDVSGLKYTVDTSIETTIEVDDTDALVSVGPSRRVKNVQVLENNTYVNIDLNKTYKVAMTDYIAKNGGAGTTYLLKDHKLDVDCALEDYQTLITYITEYLNGDLTKYTTIEGRITIE